MKMKNILFILIGFFLLSLIISSCNSSGSGSFDLGTTEETQKLSSDNIVGAWSYEDPFLGKVFLQFEYDGTLRTYTNYEGEVMNVCQWQLDGNKISVNSDCTFFNELDIFDFDGNSFVIVSNNNVSEGDGKLTVTRLKDEAGEPILHYSIFQREPYTDPRYDDGQNNSDEVSTNSDYNESNVQSQPTSNCNWCGVAFQGDGYSYSKFQGRCSIETGSYYFTGDYCSKKCANEACWAEN